MKLLLCTSDQSYLQNESQAREFLAAHASIMAETHVIVLSSKGAGLLRAQVVPNVWLYATNTATRFMRPFDAYRIARNIAPFDLVVSEDPLLAGVAGLLTARANHVNLQTVVRERALVVPTGKPSIMNRMRTLVARFVVQNSNCLRLYSSQEQTLLRSQGLTRGKNIAIVPPYRTQNDTAPVSAESTHTTHYAWPFVALSVITDDIRSSNPEQLVEIYAELAKAYPWIGFIVRVPSWYVDTFRTLVAAHAVADRMAYDVVEEGEQKKLPEAGALICAAAPGADAPYLAEAARSGVPIVSTAVGLAYDTLKDTESAFICDSADTACFSARIRTLIEDNGERTRLSIAARAVVPPLEVLTSEEWFQRLRHGYETCALNVFE